ARVVRAERNLALLRSVRNDALLGAAEVVVEQVLEPHTRDEQEVPPVGGASLHDVVQRAVGTNLAVVASGDVVVFFELFQQIEQLEVLRSLEWVVVLHEQQRHAQTGHKLSAGCIVDLRNVFAKLVALQERGDWHGFLGLLVNHYGHTSATVGMASTGELPPV